MLFRGLAGIARLLDSSGLFGSDGRFRPIHAIGRTGRPSSLGRFRTLLATRKNNPERRDIPHGDHAQARDKEHIEVARIRERRAHQGAKRRAERDRKHVITHALAFARKRDSAAHDRRDRCLRQTIKRAVQEAQHDEYANGRHVFKSQIEKRARNLARHARHEHATATDLVNRAAEEQARAQRAQNEDARREAALGCSGRELHGGIARHGDHERVILHIQNEVHRKAGNEARRKNRLIGLAGLDSVRFLRSLRHRLGLLG